MDKQIKNGAAKAGKVKMNDDRPTRTDDAFTRKVIFYFGTVIVGLLVTGAVALTQIIPTMQAQLTAQDNKISSNATNIKKFEDYYRAIIDIRLMVERLVESGEATNNILKKMDSRQEKTSMRQDVIFGEQKERGPRLTTAEKNIEDIRRRLRGK